MARRTGRLALVMILATLLPMAIEGAGLPKRPPPPKKLAPKPETLDSIRRLFLLDTSRLEQSKPSEEFQKQAEGILADPAVAVYYRREGSVTRGKPGERLCEFFLMTWVENVKADTDFGKDVQLHMAGPLDVPKTRLLCTLGGEGTWRGIVYGEGEPPACVAQTFQAMLKDPTRPDWPPKDPREVLNVPHTGLYYAAKAMPDNRWGIVVGDVNAGTWIWESASQVTDANARRLIAGQKSKPASVSIQRTWDGRTAIHSGKAICPALLIADRSTRALGGAANPAPGPEKAKAE